MKKLIIATGLLVGASFLVPTAARACPGAAKESQSQAGSKKNKSATKAHPPRKPQSKT